MRPLHFYLISMAVVLAHLVLTLWCTDKTPLRIRSVLLRIVVCTTYCASLYVFSYLYKPYFYIDAMLINAAFCIAFIAVIRNMGLREAIFVGIAITLCYDASKAAILHPWLQLTGASISQFETEPLARIMVELFGFILAVIPLGVIRRRSAEIVDGELTPSYLLALLQPLLILLAVNAWQLPTVDARNAPLTIAPTVIVIVAEASVITSTLIIVFALTAKHRSQEVARLEELINYQHDELMKRSSSEEAYERIAHDIKNHVTCISELNSSSQIEDHLKGIGDEIYTLRRFPYTGNSTLDIILNEKAREAKAANIDFEVLMDFSKGDFLQSIDICAIFGNALDNALRAVREVTDPARRVITVKSTDVSMFLVISMTNYFETPNVWRNGRLMSKRRGSTTVGLGIRSIEHSLSKYDGTVQIGEEDNLFTLDIAIPLPTANR